MPATRRYALKIVAFVLLMSAGVAIRAAIPVWTPTGSMTVARMGGLPFLMPDGRVLVIGGSSTGGTADFFDPSTGTWSPGPSSDSSHRQLPAAVRLPDGRILITGGREDSGATLAGADLYDPSANTWSAAAPMQRPRVGHTLTLLADGRVLAVGGYSDTYSWDNTAEIYNPAGDAWAFTAGMGNGRWLHTASRLNDGRVMVVGGEHYSDPLGPHFKLTQFYNPATATWTAGPPMNAGRAGHGAALLPDGRLMVMGGISGWGTPYLATTEFFNGTSWQPGPAMAQARLHFPPLAMRDGTVLVTGGTYAETGPQVVTAGAERFDPATNAWTSSGVMNTPRRFHAAIELADGRVLVAGGQDGTVFLASSEIMSGDPVAPQTTAARSLAPNGNGWNNGDVTITLDAADNAGGSGVQSLVYSLTGAQAGGGTVAGATASIVISTEGTTTLTYHAKDVAGNVEADQALLVRIDKTLPILAGQPNLTAAATAGGTVITFNASATDGPSGVVSVTSSPLSSGMRFPAGTTTVQLTALDAAGNAATSSFTVTVVPSAPVITVTGGDFVADGNTHPAGAIARDSTGATVAGTMSIAYTPGGASAPSAPGTYSAAATFISSDPGIQSALPWMTMASDPRSNTSPAVVAINGKLYVYGFDSDSGGGQGSFVPRLSIYDPASNAWTIGASPSLIRAAVSVGAINGKLYVAGGCIMSDCRIGITNALEIYDPVANTWSNGAPMATGRLGAAAGVVNGLLYVIGGTLACPPCAPTSVTESYNPATNTWTPGAAIPVPHENPASAVVNGLLYVIGGYERNPASPTTGAPGGRVDVYDPIANNWATRTPMPTARYGAAAGVVSGTIHVIGGYGTAALATNESYDPQSNTWAPGPPMLTARTAASAGVIDSKVYVAGANPRGILEAFDPSLTARITISAPINQAPSANAGGPYLADLGGGVTLNGSGSSDQDAGDSLVQFAWTIDGTLLLSGVNASLTAAQVDGLGAGPHQVLLTVTDTFGATGSASGTLTIYNNAPTASFNVNPNPAACTQFLTFNGSASGAGRPDRSIVSYTWNFGDGTPVVAGGSSFVNHVYAHFGSYTATLTVTDNNAPAKMAATSVLVNVNQGNQPPFANAGGPYSVNAGSPVVLNGSLSSDSNAGCGDSIVSYEWTVDGTIQLSGPNPTLDTAVHTLGAGSHSVSLRVADTFGATATASTTVNVQAVLVSISVSPSASTLGPGQNQTFQAIGHFSDGTTKLLPSGGGGGGGGSIWDVRFAPGIGLDPVTCGVLGQGDYFNSEVIAADPSTGVIIPTIWEPGNPLVQVVGGQVTPSQISFTVMCTSSSASGSFSAAWNGQAYVGTFTGVSGQGAAVTITPQGGGNNGPNPPRWSVQFVSSSLNVSACATAQYPAPLTFAGQGITDRQGTINETWSPGTPVTTVEGSINATAVALTIACTNGAASGTINALWTGTQYDGTFSFDGGASTGTVSITGWSQKAPLPAPRFSLAAAAVNGIVYAMGGVSPGGWPSAVEAYDPATNSWTTVQQMVTPREGAGAAAVNGRIYVVGGNEAGGIKSPVIEAFDAATRTWITGLTPMPTPRAHLAVVTDGVYIYALGGDTTGTNGGVVPTVERYDPASNTWATLAPMPSPGSFIAAGVLGGDIIVTGSGGGNSSATDVFTIATNTWRAAPPMPAGRSLAAAGVANGGLYLVGGSVNGQPAYDAWVYYPATATRVESWSGVGSMPTARAQAAAAVVNNVVYLIGGMVPGSSPAIEMAENEALSTPPVNTYAPGGAFIGNNGGGGGGSSSLPTVQWQSTNPSAAGVDGSGNAHANAPGQTTIVATASNGLSCMTSNTCATLTVVDTMPPFLGLPNDQTRQATGPSGASVTFFASANDSVDGQRPVTCSPQSGAMFAFGATIVTCSASDTSGNTATGTFTITVQDTNPPFMSAPSGNQTRQATGPAGALVTYTATANDSVDGPRPVTCNPASGTQFPFGPTPVTCSASDTRGNTVTRTFTIIVQDINPPFLNVPFQPFDLDATSAAGAVVSFGGMVSAFDSVDGAITPSCTPASGSMFPIGSTNVTCQATDAHGNQSPAKSFTVIITDRPMISVPANIVAEATSAAGAMVPFTATASSFGDGALPVQCLIITGFVDGDPQLGAPVASGSVFPLGSTTVGCLATSSTNTTEGDLFTITVADTTPPALILPPAVTTNATSAAGAVVAFVASAIDLVGGARPVVCAPPSGSAFVIGTTTVNCSSADALGNSATGAFPVTVLGAAQIVSGISAEMLVIDFQQGLQLLQNVVKSLDAGNTGTACGQLGAFINQVQAAAGKKLTALEADGLIGMATDAKAALGCP